MKELKPRYSSILDRDAVFAATHPEIAVAMAGHWTDEDFSFGRDVSSRQDPDRVPYVLQELWDGALFEFFSEPFYLYEVDHKGFYSNKKLQDFEVVSYKPVGVLDEKKIDDPLKWIQDSEMVQVKTHLD